MVSRPRLFVVIALLAAAALGAFLMLRPGPEPAPAEIADAPPVAPAADPAPVEPPAPEPAEPPAARPRAAAPRPPAAAEPPPPAAPADVVTLRIDSDVPGAQVFVDRRFLGTAPVTAEQLAPGAHQINVTAPGQESYAESVDLAAGTHELVVRFREVRLDVRADVIHKHRFGSCRGTLIATVDGLRYETTNRGDAFSAPLTALDPLEVDYLAKNLRVRPTGGRQYDFTDPEENADRLFVFQRDVNRARERLLETR